MVSFQKGHMDPSGNYTGASYGCGVASILFLLGIFATAILIGWPFLVIHGPVAWLVEIPYVLIAGTIGLAVLASKSGKKGQHRSGDA